MTRYLVTEQQLRRAIHSAIRTLDLSKQDDNYTINGQPENDAEYYRRILEIYKNNPDPLFCHNCGQRFKYVGQDQLAYKHQSNRADILHTLKLKAETQPTFDLAELNQ